MMKEKQGAAEQPRVRKARIRPLLLSVARLLAVKNPLLERHRD